MVDESATLRSGWRFAAFLIAFVVTTVLLGTVVIGFLLAAGMSPESRPVMFLVVNSVVSLGPAILIGWLCGKYIEKIPFRALGVWFTRLWFRHFMMGCFVGAVTVGIAVLVAAAFGGLRFTANGVERSAIIQTLITSFGIFAIAAAFEEVLFRGYILQTFARSGLAPFAIALTSIFFGIVHLNNPNVGIISTTNTMLAGIWFGIAYLKTRDLWFVWGMHLVWNWMQGAVFGIEVSGLTDITKASVLTEIDAGPVWLTGGAYGLEGGVACTAAIILSTLAIQFLPLLKSDDEMLALTSPRPGPASTNT